MAEAQSNISFFSLSAELRNRIYDLVLCPTEHGDGGEPRALSTAIYIGHPDEDAVDDVGSDDEDDFTFFGIHRTVWATQPPITKVSRQVRLEALPIYYGTNRFLVYEKGGEIIEGGREVSFPGAIEWLKAIGPANARLLKNINVRQLRHPDKRLVDCCPATRFRAHAARCGINLPPIYVTGFVYGWPGWEGHVFLKVDETHAKAPEDGNWDVVWDKPYDASVFSTRY